MVLYKKIDKFLMHCPKNSLTESDIACFYLSSGRGGGKIEKLYAV